MLEAITTLIKGTYGLVTAICLAVGLILLAIEIFIPGFGVCGITGITLVVFSVLFRVITSKNILHFVSLLAIIIIAIALFLLIGIRSARYGLLSKTPIIETSTSIPTDYADDSKNYGFLINKVGVTKTICKPIGKMELDNVEYQVISNGDYIDADTKVKVVEVDGSTIIVKKEENK